MSKILIVDDDPLNLKLSHRILNKRGHEVILTNEGQKALDYLAKNSVDLILLDVVMPGMDGFQVMEQLRKWHPEISVVLLTADEDKDTEIRAFREGALEFIKKPFVAEVLVSRVERILQLERLQKYLQQEVERQTRQAEERRRKVERMSEQMMQTLADAIDAKDKYTNGHSIRVAAYSREIARRAGKSAQEQKHIYDMALLHDIGKIGISDEIINKTSELTDEEYEIIKSHPVIGSDILENMTELAYIGIGARWHHERWDGKGYPDGLKGTEIPEEARIIGVADAYDAMSSKRKYRDVLPQEVVQQEIQRGRGTQFDPVFTDIMLDMIAEDTGYHMHE